MEKGIALQVLIFAEGSYAGVAKLWQSYGRARLVHPRALTEEFLPLPPPTENPITRQAMAMPLILRPILSCGNVPVADIKFIE